MVGHMRVHRAVVILIAILVMWTAVSFLMLATISHAPCVPPVVFAPDGSLDKAAMDAKVAACMGPRIPADLVNQPIPVLGYLLIVGFGVAYAARGKREGSHDQ
jgi:hypothetical protein